VLESNQPIVLYGYSGHAFVVADAILKCKLALYGYIDFQPSNKNYYKLEYIGFERDVNFTGWKKGYGFVLAVGNNQLRRTFFENLIAQNERAINIFHPSAVISDLTSISNGVVILANANVNPLAQLGNGVIVNTGATVEHECKIGDFVHIAPGVTLAGNVEVGENTFIGANAVVKEGVKIGKNVVVGAGTVVVKDIQDKMKIYGNPGKIR
jgi:sugar O-acyltransferase (sialic acid O-acetyltransferase NeuD family)